MVGKESKRKINKIYFSYTVGNSTVIVFLNVRPLLNVGKATFHSKKKKKNLGYETLLSFCGAETQ